MGPDPLPENFYVDSWMPQIEVLALPTLKVCISHCGWGGVLETMQFAAPVLGFPGGIDQIGNAALLEKQGCGLQINPTKFTARKLTAALRSMLQNYEHHHARATAIQGHLLASGGAPAAVKVIEDAVAR